MVTDLGEARVGTAVSIERSRKEDSQAAPRVETDF